VLVALSQATDVRGVRGISLPDRLDRRGSGAPRRGPLKTRMCEARAWERYKFDQIGVGVAGRPRLWPSLTTDVRGVPRSWPSQATDVRGVRGEYCKFDLIVVGVFGTPRSWPSQTTGVQGVRAERCKLNPIVVGVAGTPRSWPSQATDAQVRPNRVDLAGRPRSWLPQAADVWGVRGSAASSTRSS
jgi:hypothetical protein